MTDTNHDMFTAVDNNDLLEHLNNAGDSALDNIQWPKTFAEIVDQIKHYFETQHDMTAEQALKQATGVGVLLAQFGGGRQFYLPSVKSIKRNLRDTKIWHEFDGRNIDALCTRYDLTIVHIYTILKEQRQLTVNRRQRQLFDLDES